MKPNLATFLLIAGIVGAAIPTRASDYETVTFAAPALGGMTVSVNVILPGTTPPPSGASQSCTCWMDLVAIT